MQPNQKHRQHATNIPKHAVLIDGSALFLASKVVAEASRLNHRALIKILRDQVLGLQEPATPGNLSLWSMWTAAAPDNPGQGSFLDFTERELHWQVRRFLPSQSFMIEPMAIFGAGGEPNRSGRLVRFDAAISFAIGRLAETHRIIVISDSFPLAEPLARVSDNFGSSQGKPVLAFFGRALDSRWYSLLKQPNAPQFVDLDDFDSELFGIPKIPLQGGKTSDPVF